MHSIEKGHDLSIAARMVVFVSDLYYKINSLFNEPSWMSVVNKTTKLVANAHLVCVFGQAKATFGTGYSALITGPL